MESVSSGIILALRLKLSEPQCPLLEMGVMISSAYDYGMDKIRAFRGSQPLNLQTPGEPWRCCELTGIHIVSLVCFEHRCIALFQVSVDSF